LQVSGVSGFFGSVLDGVLLLFSRLRLLDRLSNQLVSRFVRDVYTYEKMPCRSYNGARYSGGNAIRVKEDMTGNPLTNNHEELAIKGTTWCCLAGLISD
jgi:hypothetical protein